MTNTEMSQLIGEFASMSSAERNALVRLNVLRLEAAQRVAEAKKKVTTLNATDVPRMLSAIRAELEGIDAFRATVLKAVEEAKALKSESSLLLKAIDAAHAWMTSDEKGTEDLRLFMDLLEPALKEGGAL